MTISQLAEKAGVSPRALRHYETLGLLRPARKGTYRTYSAADLLRVRQIRSLVALGFKLEQIGSLLGDEAPSPHQLIEFRLRKVEAEVRQLQHLRDKLARLSTSPPSTTEELLLSLEVINMLENPEVDIVCLELGTELVPLCNLFGKPSDSLLDGLRRVRADLEEAGVYLPGVRVRDLAELNGNYRLWLFGEVHAGARIVPDRRLAVNLPGSAETYPGLGPGSWVGADFDAPGTELLTPVEVILRHLTHLFREHSARLNLAAPVTTDHAAECECQNCRWVRRGSSPN